MKLIFSKNLKHEILDDNLIVFCWTQHSNLKYYVLVFFLRQNIFTMMFSLRSSQAKPEGREFMDSFFSRAFYVLLRLTISRVPFHIGMPQPFFLFGQVRWK